MPTYSSFLRDFLFFLEDFVPRILLEQSCILRINRQYHRSS